MRAQGEAGARLTRSTMSWAPTRMALAMERDGMTKFWKTKVKTKRTVMAVTHSGAKGCSRDSGGSVFSVDFVICIPPLIGRFSIHPALVPGVLALLVGVEEIGRVPNKE